MENKKKILLAGMLLMAIILTVGVSFALWQLTLTQTDSNVITTGCFQVTFTDKNPIHLTYAYPVSDEEGATFKPYTFTIENTCDSYITYQINLEILNSTTLTKLEYIKTTLNESIPSVLTNYERVSTTLDDATDSKKLETGYINPNEIKTFALRLWMDEDTPVIEEVMEKVFESKVTIITSFLPEEPTFSERVIACSKSGYKTSECVKENSEYDTNLVYDETVDNNLRYVGANPNNYVLFNNELWRIIGVMENVEDELGTIDSRIKIIRDTSIGIFPWDTSASGIHKGLGINEWSQAKIMKLMNPGYESESIGGSLYWNRTSGSCYTGRYNGQGTCDFSESGFLEKTKEFIAKVVWNTGAQGTAIAINNILASNFYELERSDNTGKVCTSGEECNANVERTTKWLGFVGLMSPSDYGFATNGGMTKDRLSCLNTPIYNWEGQKDCYNNDWLYKGLYQWTMMPRTYPSSAALVFSIQPIIVNSNGGSDGRNIFPSVFLKSNLKIISGNGSEEQPFVLV